MRHAPAAGAQAARDCYALAVWRSRWLPGPFWGESSRSTRRPAARIERPSKSKSKAPPGQLRDGGVRRFCCPAVSVAASWPARRRRRRARGGPAMPTPRMARMRPGRRSLLPRGKGPPAPDPDAIIPLLHLFGGPKPAGHPPPLGPGPVIRTQQPEGGWIKSLAGCLIVHCNQCAHWNPCIVRYPRAQLPPDLASLARAATHCTDSPPRGQRDGVPYR
jgi:hypothetical protein